MSPAARIFCLLAGLFGACGIAAGAAAAHGGYANLDTVSLFLLAHAPAMLALGLLRPGRTGAAAGGALALGVALFCGDLALRDLAGLRILPMAAPAGGMLMIAGWLAVGVAAAMRRQSHG